jgi:hypothetical protein
MSKDEYLKLSKELAKPINFEELVRSGALIQKGKSYYLGKKDALPRHVTGKVKSLEQTKNGMKVTFYK